MQQTKIKLYIEQLEKDPQNFKIHAQLGVLYKQIKQYEKAEQQYKLAIKYKEDYYEVYNSLGIIYYETKQYEKAEQQYNLAMKYKEDYYEVYNNLGNLYRDIQQYDKAEQQYKLAIKYKEDYYLAYNNFGILYIQTKQYEKAEQQYKLAIKYKEDYYKPYYNLGNLYREKKQYEKAEQQYNLAMKYKEDYSDAYGNLGNNYLDQKLYGKAEQYLKMALKLNKNSNTLPIIYKNLGILYKNYFQNYSKSKNFYEKIKNLEKYKQIANNNLKFLNEQIQQEKNKIQKFYLSEEEFDKNYQQLEKIGQGQYGSVFRIKNIQTNKNYAMKVIPLEWDRDEILHEVNNILQLQLKFNSKSIVKVHFVVETKPKYGSSQILIAMELSQGTLQNIKKPLTQKQVTNLIQLTLKGLEEMYFQDMIHRDIKPDNILYFEEDQSFKFTDFGTSRFTQNNQNKTVSLLTLIGTPAYLGPELFNILKEKGLGGQQLDKEDTKSVDWYANDVYGLGMSFFFAICQVESVTSFRNKPDLIRQELEKMEKQNKYDPIVYNIIEQMTQQDQKNRANILFDLIETSKQLK